MQRSFPKLCPASLWALAHCMNKQRFTFGTVTGTNNLRCDPTFKAQFEDYIRTKKQVDPAQYEIITIASCTGHSFVYTREIPDGESEDIEYLTPRAYARLGSICHGTHISNDQSILRQGLDVDYGVKTGLARRNMIHCCPSTNELPLKRQGLYCYLDLKVAITDLNIRVMYSKTAQIVLVEDRVPPEALCLTWKEPADLGSMCLPKESDLIKPCGPDAPAVPIKRVGEIFKASPMLRPRTMQGAATSSLATIAEADQPIVIEDDEDAPRTGASASSGTTSAPSTLQTKRSSLLKAPPTVRPKVLLKRPPVTVTKVPPPVEKYAVPRGPVVQHFNISDFPMYFQDWHHRFLLRQRQHWHLRHRLCSHQRSLRSPCQKGHQLWQLRSRDHLPGSRCSLRLMLSCVMLKRSEQRGLSSSSSFTMTRCPLSSSLSSRTQFLIAQWGLFLGREGPHGMHCPKGH